MAALALVHRFEQGFGHSFAFADGGRWAAATTGMVHLWEGDRLVQTVAVPGYLRGGIRFSGDGQSLRVALWVVDSSTGSATRVLADRDLLVSVIEGEAASYPELFTAELVEWSPDGSRAVVVTKYNPTRGLDNDYQHQGPDGQVLLVDAASERVVNVLDADIGLMAGKGVAAADRFVAVSGPGLVVYSLDSGELVTELADGGGFVAARFSPDGSRLGAIQRSGTVTLWETVGWAPVASWPTSGPSAPVLAFDAGGERLASAARAGPVEMWSLTGGGTSPALVASSPAEHGVQGLAFDPAGRLFVASTPPGQAIQVLAFDS